MIHLLLAGKPSWGTPLGSVSERRVATLSNHGSWISNMSKVLASSCRIPCMRPLLRWTLTDMNLIRCSDISRGGVSVSRI